MRKYWALTATTLALLAGMATPGFAQEREHMGHERGHFPERPAEAMREPARPRLPPPVAMRVPAPGFQLDQRYHHDHYYPPRGHAVAVLPQGSVSIGFRGNSWFFHGGVWFQPMAGRYVVTLPPIGIFTPVLPPSYATLWIQGAPYYYANGVYYAPSPGQGYVVVAPPPGADTAQAMSTLPPQVPAEPVIYPRQGQSTAQTAIDRQECGRWAATQPGADVDPGVLQRALAACMDARGYTVR